MRMLWPCRRAQIHTMIDPISSIAFAHRELFMSHMMNVILGTEPISSSHNSNDKRHGEQCDDTSSQERPPQHCEKKKTTSAPISSGSMLRITAPNSKQKRTSAPHSPAIRTRWVRSHSFVVPSFFLMRAQVRIAFHRATVRCFSVRAPHDKRRFSGRCAEKSLTEHTTPSSVNIFVVRARTALV